ncbi:MAG: hypothetical protein APF76_04790 [Desulfitibacter sp. BRH_c19]|nr:MAG: hypothetical protein APF76_04790 [Desulfitibacter sp. BRH_c19]
MKLHDRFINGFIAGAFAGIILDLLNYLSYKLNITEITYWEWASVLIYGYRTEITFEIILALVMQIFFAGIVGIVFAYLIKYVTSNYLLTKGVIYSLFVWFSANAITYMYDVSPLSPIKGDTVISNLITVSIYGIVLAMLIKRLESEH